MPLFTWAKAEGLGRDSEQEVWWLARRRQTAGKQLQSYVPARRHTVGPRETKKGDTHIKAGTGHVIWRAQSKMKM